MRGSSQTGFTVIELMITVAVAAVLVAIAVPNFSDALVRSRVAGAADELQSALGLARAEALKLKLPVTVCANVGEVCANENSWNNGFMVFHDPNGNGVRDGDETILRTRRFDQTALLITAEAGTVSLLGNGRLADGTERVFDIRGPGCTPGGTIGDNGKRRRLTITASGRAAVRRTAC